MTNTEAIRTPDYYTFTAGFNTKIPGLEVTPGTSLTYDWYGNLYVNLGASGGPSPIFEIPSGFDNSKVEDALKNEFGLTALEI